MLRRHSANLILQIEEYGHAVGQAQIGRQGHTRHLAFYGGPAVVERRPGRIFSHASVYPAQCRM